MQGETKVILWIFKTFFCMVFLFTKLLHLRRTQRSMLQRRVSKRMGNHWWLKFFSFRSNEKIIDAWCSVGVAAKERVLARGTYAKREDKKNVIKSYWCTSFVRVIAWGRVKSRVFSEVAIFATSENTSDILILNFTTIHCDYLLIARRAKFLNA